MVGDPGDRRIVPVDGDDPFDDADRKSGALEGAALLDVQLEIAMMGSFGAARVEDAIRIAADLPDRVAAPHPVPDFVHVRRRHVAGGDAAAGEATAEGVAFFMRPDDHLRRVSCADTRRVQRFDGAEGRQRTEVAVEVPAARNGVDV